MSDVFTKEKRRYVMSRIRSKGTKIELVMAEMLRTTGCRYEIHPKVYGSPDFVIVGKKIAIFCDGDFWHGYGYDPNKHAKKFWRDKIENNMRRDRRVARKLRRDGWSVLRFWEHDIEKRHKYCMGRITRTCGRVSDWSVATKNSV